jgi:lathosterol oxidase
MLFWYGDVATNISNMQLGTHNPYREVNQWLNSIFFSFTRTDFIFDFVMKKLGPEAGYYMVSYLRDLVAGTIVYWVTAGLWHFVIYNVYGKSLFIDKGRPFPATETLVDQMSLAQASLFVYAGLPIFSEFLIESKLTKTYYYIDQIGGWGFYALYLVIYLSIVEVGIYWMHRTLHTNKFLYKYIHALHHKYNKQITMTPWCSIAFNPLDGILQASPYVIALFIVPMHYFTHIFLIFFSGMWATNIHDAVWGDSEPIMGAKYHLVHHTHYHYNFGQFFIFCDYIFGTLKVPEKSKMD